MRYCKRIMIYASLGITFAGCGVTQRSPIEVANTKEAWNLNNDPSNLKGQYEVKLAALPQNGEVTRKPWTDTYWPSHQAGLANRWNDPSRPNPFKYTPPKLVELQAMTREQLGRLSPAEKYDIFVDRLDYPLVHSERERTSPEDPAWFGLCHGWAPAAINFDEPHPVTLTGVNGVEIPFGSSDVKALLTYLQQEGLGTHFLGDRCDHDISNSPDRGDDPECRDTNAGSFHIVIANQLGLLDEAFVADVTRDFQVWNQPIFGFKATVLGETDSVYPNAAAGTVRIVTVETRLSYIAEMGPNWNAMPFDEYPYQATEKLLRYQLEVNSDGEIIGGEWLTSARPDFLWTQKPPRFEGYLRQLETIYKAATHI